MFVRAPNPIWYFVNLAGQQLNDNYWIFFLQNTFPYLPQPIFQDPNGLVAWSDPLQFYPNGTLPDNLYFDDTLVYRLEIRKGSTQDDPLIYEVNNFVPCCASGITPIESSVTTDNQVSNPQFAYVSFKNSVTYTAAGTYEVAPGWLLELTGSGTTSAVITQITTIAGNQDIINNPPYALGFTLSGWATASLYQRYSMNGALWGSTPDQNGSVSASVTGEATGGVSLPLTLSYRPSVGDTQIIAAGTLMSGTYSVIDGAIILESSTNTDTSPTAYVDLLVTLPTNGAFNLTNFQLIGNGNAGTTAVSLDYEQQTIERGLDQLFHYYYNSIIFQPKDDILTAWNFSLNPWQFSPTATTTISAICSYITDQTILYQKTASSVSVEEGSRNTNNALTITAVLSTNQFALIQYVDATTVAPYWNTNLSSLVTAALGTTAGSNIQFKMRLIYNANVPSTLSATDPILSWSGTDPIFSSGWTAIIPENDPVYTLGSNAGYADFPFNKFTLPGAGSNNFQTLGIVIYTLNNMSSSGTADFINVKSISLVRNDFAIDTNPITFDQSLRKCQFYYEKSYDWPVLPATINLDSQLLIPQNIIFNGSGAWSLYATPFTIPYKVVKRGAGSSPPTITFYSPTNATINAMDCYIYNGENVESGATVNINNWTAVSVGIQGAVYYPTSANLLIATPGIFTGVSALVGFANTQYTIDARLGR